MNYWLLLDHQIRSGRHDMFFMVEYMSMSMREVVAHSMVKIGITFAKWDN
jgi:hypothetical protein